MNTTQQHIAFLLLLSGCSIVLLGMTCYTQEISFGVLFFLSLCVSVGFYLFQFGTLDSFTLKGLSAEVSFIKEKKQEVERDAEEVKKDAEEVARIKAHAEALSVVLEQTRKETQDKLRDLNDNLKRTTELAEAPTLAVSKPVVAVVDAGLKATIQFWPSKNEPLGILIFDVSLTPDSEARIVDLWPVKGGGAFQAGSDSKKIDRDGRKARLEYSLLSAGSPVIDITVSNECRVTIAGNYCEQAIVIDITTPPAQSTDQNGE